jgi:hypothetical protein
MANIFREPLVLTQGTGVTINLSGQLLQAKTRESVTISIGNDVSVTGNPVFVTLTPTNEQFQINQYIIKPNALTGSISLLGSLTSDSLTIGGDMSVLGTTTAQKIESQLTQSVTLFESGSTQFGDTSDDTHQFSGSFLSSGSFSVGNYSVSRVSNDTSLTDGSSTDLVTEKAVKTYLDANDDDTISAYFRKCFAHTGSFVSSTTSSFTAVTASAPTGFTSTSEHDFVFFINGQLMEHDGVSVKQAGTSFLLHIDGDSIGYDLTTEDEVVAWGKFNS